MGSLTDDRCSSASILHQGVGFVTLLASHIIFNILLILLSVSHEKTKTADSAYEQQRRPAGRGRGQSLRARARARLTDQNSMTSE